MAFTYDTKTRVAPSTANPVTTNYTCGANAKLLIVTLAYAYNASGRGNGAPTYNGVSLKQADQVRNHSASPEACAELWYMVNPPVSSSYVVNVPNPNGLSVELVVSSYNCASGYTACLQIWAGGSGSSSSPSVSLTTKAISVIIAVLADGYDTAPTGRSGTTLYETDNGAWSGNHQYYIQTAAGTRASSWTVSSDDWGMCVAAFQEVRQGTDTSKIAGHIVTSSAKGDSASKLVGHIVTSSAKGVSSSKAVAHIVVIGNVWVAQVAEEIVYTTDSAPVQIAQVSEEIVYTTEAAPVQVAQVAQEIVLADYIQTQVAQTAFEILVLPTDTQVQVAQAIFEALVSPTDTQVQVAHAGFEVLIQNVYFSSYVWEGSTDVILDASAEYERGIANWEFSGSTSIYLDTSAASYSGEFGIAISQVSLSALVRADGPVRISQDVIAPIVRANEPLRISQSTLSPVVRAHEPLRISQITVTAIIRNVYKTRANTFVIFPH